MMISFPAISTGNFGYPVIKCVKVMISAVKEYLKCDTIIKEVIFHLFFKADYDVFKIEIVE